MLCEVAEVLVLVTKLRNINSHIGIDGAIFPVPSLVLTFQSKVQAQCKDRDQSSQSTANGSATKVERSGQALC